MSLIHKASGSPADPIIEVADHMAPALRDAFLSAAAVAATKMPLSAIVTALQSGDVNRVVAVLNGGLVDALKGKGLEANMTSLRQAIQETFRQAAQAATEQLPRKAAVDLSFNLLNPESVNFLQRYEFDLIQQISVESRAAIQQTVLRAFREGGHPYEQARQVKQVIGLTARQEQAIANYRNYLEQGQYEQALNRALRDGRYDRTILSNIKNGKKLRQEQIDKMVERYRQRYLKHRSEMIARTESIRASNQGRRELWRQAKEQGLMGSDARRKWVVSGDERTCEECLALDGEERGLDEEFAPGVMDPPDPHPNCRCAVVLVSRGRTAASMAA